MKPKKNHYIYIFLGAGFPRHTDLSLCVPFFDYVQETGDFSYGYFTLYRQIQVFTIFVQILKSFRTFFHNMGGGKFDDYNSYSNIEFFNALFSYSIICFAGSPLIIILSQASAVCTHPFFYIIPFTLNAPSSYQLSLGLGFL